ncbi:MAG: hypothetical protein Q3979_05590 [Actinomycetaceae bacterium]|nr:hypothetical protein [Actinomycetaceae bacterium]
MARVRLNHGEIKNYLKSPVIQGWVAAEAEQIRARCGPGFTVVIRTNGNRVRAYVRPDTYKARRDQARYHVIERAVGRSI